MIIKTAKNVERKRRHARIRKKVTGTNERPRLNVFRSNKHVYAQLIDDAKGVTLVSASTIEKEFGEDAGVSVETAAKVGKLIAERAMKNGHKQVVFDRGGYLYHGRIKALAEAAREVGLEF